MAVDPAGTGGRKQGGGGEPVSPLPCAGSATGARWRGSAGGGTGHAPAVVDVTITGHCQLRCGFCWGPAHDERSEPDGRRWARLIRRLSDGGTVRMVFSGGEPLLSPLLPGLLEQAHSLGVQTTLSTNGVLLAGKAGLLRHVSQIGIPVDAACEATNEVMRPRSARYQAWRRSIDGIVLAQSHGVPVIVRTVVTPRNLHEVPDIPAVLQGRGVDLATDRIMYKLYRAARIGPIPSAVLPGRWEEDYAVRDGLVEEVGAVLRARYPRLSVTTQDYRDSRGRYFLVDPLGNAFGVDPGEGGSQPRRVAYGNVFDAYDEAIARHAAGAGRAAG